MTLHEEFPAMSRLDLSLKFEQRGRRMELVVEYKTALFDSSSAERIASATTAVLRAMVASPAMRVSEVATVLLSDPEKREQEAFLASMEIIDDVF
jgi:hypothetical protein